MKKKEIKQKGWQRIDQEGKSRQETFEELCEESDRSAEDIGKILRYIIPHETRKKYKVPHAVLMFVLLLTILVKLFMGLAIVAQHGASYTPVLFIIPLVNVFFLIAVLKYWGWAYNGVAIFGVISLSQNLGDIIDDPSDPFRLIGLVVVLALIGLGFYLHFKMTPEPEEVKEEYVDKKGKKKLRNKLQFMD